MTQLDFRFEETDWAAFFASSFENNSLSAARFLMLMEDQPEDQVEEALLYLEATGIRLDISDLPRPAAVGQAALRLHREDQLVRSGTLRTSLEENDPLRLYLEEVASISAPADVQAMARRFAGGYEQVLPGLTNAMLPAVVDMACMHTGWGVLLLDLIQEGSLGLWQGILSYRGGDFDTHVRWWIQQYFARAITLQARENGVGQKMKQAMEDFRAVDGRLLTELGRNATLPEIATAMHMTLEETQAVAGMLESARMLESAKPEEKEEDPQEQEQAVEDTAYFQMRQRVSELLGCLNEEDAKLLTLRFGLEGGLPLSPEEIGAKLGMTPEAVVAREAAALNKLRNQ